MRMCIDQRRRWLGCGPRGRWWAPKETPASEARDAAPAYQDEVVLLMPDGTQRAPLKPMTAEQASEMFCSKRPFILEDGSMWLASKMIVFPTDNNRLRCALYVGLKGDEHDDAVHAA